MASKRIVVIGASSGGIDALRTLVGALPPRFPAPICIVLHTGPDSPGMLAEILRRAGPLPVSSATNATRLDESRIYVAPPDHHLLVEPGALHISKGPTENRFRPAIDPLFRSAAQVYGPAAIGVVLTGNLDDGTAGLWAIKRLGGIAIVQDPADALFPSMPLSALRHVDVQYTLPLAGIAPLLVRLVEVPTEERSVPHSEPLEVEVKIAKALNAIDAGIERIAEPSPFSCPECHGVLMQLKDTHPLRVRCQTGHAYSVRSLIAAQSEGIDRALWAAVRAMQEGGLLLRYIAAHEAIAVDAGDSASLADQASTAHRLAEQVRQVIAERSRQPPTAP